MVTLLCYNLGGINKDLVLILVLKELKQQKATKTERLRQAARSNGG